MATGRRFGPDIGDMQFVFFMTLPGPVVVLPLLAFVDQLLMRAGRAGVLPWQQRTAGVTVDEG